MTSTKLKWTSQQTYYLLDSMKGFRPYGLDKHFHMMFILERFRSKTNMNVSADALWDHIEEYYNLNSLTERENEKLKQNQLIAKPVDFALPPDFKL